MTGPFDVVFCRNVMIYFDTEVRRRLVLEIARLLKPGGYLMIGHSESLSGIVSPLTLVQPAVYRKAAN
jgi:chemotaxis protein methyltransferase CheR